MAHYAKIENNVVTQVIVAEADFIESLDDSDSWVQTSYNTRGGKHYDPETGAEDDGTPLRKNYACIGFIYDGTGFHAPQPFDSWTLNTTNYFWEAPLDYPTDGDVYYWDEDAYQADNTTGWVAST